MRSILTHLKDNVLVADGAIGTILYSEGLDTCPEALVTLAIRIKLNVSIVHILKPVLMSFQTNTYGANFEKLKRFGLEDKVKAIHQAAVRIAKKQQIKIRIY